MKTSEVIESLIGPLAASRVLGCSATRVRQLAEERRIVGYRTANGWLLDAASVEAFAAEYKPRRRR